MTRVLWADTEAAGGVRRGSSRSKYKSAYMKKNFTAYEIKVFYKHLTRVIPGVDLSRSVVEIDSYGGAINRKEMLEEDRRLSALERHQVAIHDLLGESCGRRGT